jgi:hypothetical protein
MDAIVLSFDWYIKYVVVKPFKFKKILYYLYLYLIGIKDAIKNNMGVSENLKKTDLTKMNYNYSFSFIDDL